MLVRALKKNTWENHIYSARKFPNKLLELQQSLEISNMGFPDGAVVKNLPANAGDTGSSPVPGRSHMPRSN